MCCVVEPAKILEKAASLSVTAGDSAALEVTVTGSAPLRVKWFKDQKEMISGRKYKMSVKESTAMLKILSADKGDSAEYRMEVSNDVGKDQCSCSLAVIGQCQPITCRYVQPPRAGFDGSDVSSQIEQFLRPSPKL